MKTTKKQTEKKYIRLSNVLEPWISDLKKCNFIKKEIHDLGYSDVSSSREEAIYLEVF